MSVGVGRFRSVVGVGDLMEIFIYDQFNQMVGKLNHKVSLTDIDQAYADVQVKVDDILPNKTKLLANYPNPFNPETWIPYQLDSDAEVTIHIHSLDGNLVRRLHIGHKLAGYYHVQSRSAYWDGKNRYGELVGSGVYFYTIDADKFSGTRKMIIVK